MSVNAPYASTTSLLLVVRGLRKRNFPAKVTSKYIQSVFKIAPAMATRVLNGLLFLGFVGANGQPQEKFTLLSRSATDAEFQQRLGAAIEVAYRDILKTAHPSRGGFHQIQAAFQPYEPASQHYRMAVLLLGLCREAGIPVQQEIRLSRQKPRKRDADTPSKAGKASSVDSTPARRSPALWGLIRGLPEPGSVFPLDKREAWIDSLRAALAYAYEEPESDTKPRLLKTPPRKTPPPNSPSFEEAESR